MINMWCVLYANIFRVSDKWAMQVCVQVDIVYNVSWIRVVLLAAGWAWGVHPTDLWGGGSALQRDNTQGLHFLQQPQVWQRRIPRVCSPCPQKRSIGYMNIQCLFLKVLSEVVACSAFLILFLLTQHFSVINWEAKGSTPQIYMHRIYSINASRPPKIGTDLE